MNRPMIAYHGTTQSRARRIFDQGLLPKPPSRRVWFAESRRYAMGRAKTQARRSNDVPVVLACDLDLDEIRRERSVKGVVRRSGVIAVDGPVPPEMLRCSAFADMATMPDEVAAWVNDLLGLEPRESVRPDHPGLIRLSRWINARAASGGEPKLLCSELLEKAKRWLPEYFTGADLAPGRLREHRRVGLIDYEIDAPAIEPDPRESEALDCLDDPRADQRVRGLSLLAKIPDPDLFDWCAMCLDDEAVTVRLAALRTMLACEDGAPEAIEPLAASEDRRVRAAAIAALARHAGPDSPRWIERGLKDPEACVRVEAARFLSRLDPRRHRSIADLARHDPNPNVARSARKLMRYHHGRF
jgi:hypothetical protein